MYVYRRHIVFHAADNSDARSVNHYVCSVTWCWSLEARVRCHRHTPDKPRPNGQREEVQSVRVFFFYLCFPFYLLSRRVKHNWMNTGNKQEWNDSLKKNKIKNERKKER